MEGNTKQRQLIRNLVNSLRENTLLCPTTDNLGDGSRSIKYRLWSSSEADDLVNQSGAANPQTARLHLTLDDLSLGLILPIGKMRVMELAVVIEVL